VLDVRAGWRRLRGSPKQTKTFECTAFGPFKPLNLHVASLSTAEQSKAMGAAAKALFNPSAADVARQYFEATHPFKVHHWHYDERVSTLTCCWCGRAGLAADIAPEQINQGERFSEREAPGRCKADSRATIAGVTGTARDFDTEFPDALPLRKTRRTDRDAG
jgi:hypothetical protein